MDLQWPGDNDSVQDDCQRRAGMLLCEKPTAPWRRCGSLDFDPCACGWGAAGTKHEHRYRGRVEFRRWEESLGRPMSRSPVGGRSSAGPLLAPARLVLPTRAVPTQQRRNVGSARAALAASRRPLTRQQRRLGRRGACLLRLGGGRGVRCWPTTTARVREQRPAAGAAVKWTGELCFSRLPRHCERSRGALSQQILPPFAFLLCIARLHA
jgi:hypothetical protein